MIMKVCLHTWKNVLSLFQLSLEGRDKAKQFILQGKRQSFIKQNHVHALFFSSSQLTFAEQMIFLKLYSSLKLCFL